MSEQPSIYGRMAAVLADVGAIEKTRKNQAQGFQFRGIDDAMNELHGTFAKHSLFLTHELLEHSMAERATRSGGTSFHHIAKVRFTFWAPDGSNVAAVGIGEAADTGDKGAGKAMAYALKVCLLQTFIIPTEEEKDPDYRVTEWGKQQAKDLTKVARDSKSRQEPVIQKEVIDKLPEEILTDKHLPSMVEIPLGIDNRPPLPSTIYADNDHCKKWLTRELGYYGIEKSLVNFSNIAKEVHGLCMGKVNTVDIVKDWAIEHGFTKGKK